MEDARELSTIRSMVPSTASRGLAPAGC